jgi:hypothetical protein
LVNDVIIAKARQPWKRQLLTTISHWNNCVSIPPAVSHDTTLKLGAPVCIWWLYGGVKSFLKDAFLFSAPLISLESRRYKTWVSTGAKSAWHPRNFWSTVWHPLILTILLHNVVFHPYNLRIY